jgi:micrococcal nuclease
MIIKWAASVTLLMFFCLCTHAQTILKGKAVRILDGDTFELLVQNKIRYKIRLTDIDAPEKGQDFGMLAKKELGELLANKEIEVRYKSKDRNGRILGLVNCNGQNINLLMVEKGLAWHFKKYSSDMTYAAAEQRARSQKRGLWSQENAVAPWDYRKHKREKE